MYKNSFHVPSELMFMIFGHLNKTNQVPFTITVQIEQRKLNSYSDKCIKLRVEEIYMLHDCILGRFYDDNITISFSINMKIHEFMFSIRANQAQ